MLATALFHQAPWIQIKSCKMKSRQVVISCYHLTQTPSSLATTPTPSSSSSSSSSSSTSSSLSSLSSSFPLFLLLLFIIGDTCNYEPKPSCCPSRFNRTIPVFSFLMHDINTIINNYHNNNFITIVSGLSQLFINIIKIALNIWIKFWVGVRQLCGLTRSRSRAEVDEKFNL